MGGKRTTCGHAWSDTVEPVRTQPIRAITLLGTSVSQRKRTLPKFPHRLGHGGLAWSAAASAAEVGILDLNYESKAAQGISASLLGIAKSK